MGRFLRFTGSQCGKAISRKENTTLHGAVAPGFPRKAGGF